jgi:2-dehydro-3-deoxygluconokinase
MHSLPLKIVVFGEALATFVADDILPLERAERYSRSAGGVGIDVAIELSRLGHNTGWLSRLGSDPLGYYVLQALQQAGLDTTRILLDDHHPTGFQLKSREDADNAAASCFRTGTALSYIMPADDDDAYIGYADHLHVTGIPPVLSENGREYTYHILEQARKAGISSSFDPLFSANLWANEQEMRDAIHTIATIVDIVFINEHDSVPAIGGTTLEEHVGYYLDRGVKMVVVYAAGNGAYLFTHKRRYSVPAFSAQHKVKAATRVRDGFVAGVLHALLEKQPSENWLEQGNAMAALLAANEVTRLPDCKQLTRFLRQHEGTVQEITSSK